MFSREVNKFCVCSLEQKFNSLDSSSNVSNSLIEPSAMYKNCTNSFFDFLAAPSAILTGTETAALRICETRPNFSSLGNIAVALYTSFTNTKLSFQASRFLCGFMLYSLDKINKRNQYSNNVQYTLRTVHISPLTVHYSPFTAHHSL